MHSRDLTIVTWHVKSQIKVVRYRFFKAIFTVGRVMNLKVHVCTKNDEPANFIIDI